MFQFLKLIFFICVFIPMYCVPPDSTKVTRHSKLEILQFSVCFLHHWQWELTITVL